MAPIVPPTRSMVAARSLKCTGSACLRTRRYSRSCTCTRALGQLLRLRANGRNKLLLQSPSSSGELGDCLGVQLSPLSDASGL